MRITTWPWLLLAVLALVLAPVGCSDNGNNTPDDGGGNEDGDGGNGGDETTSSAIVQFGIQMAVDQENAGLQLDLAATPAGRFAIAYYKEADEEYACVADGDCTETPPESASWTCVTGECVAMCTTPILGDDEVPVVYDWVRFAEYDGTSWSHEDVTSFSSVMLPGISLEYDGNDALIAYLGGAGGSQMCGGSDLMVARGQSGSWNITAAVANSNEAAAGGDCPKMQSICDFGDVVGLWPSMAIAPDGTIGITYRDIHNGYTKEAQDSSDMEWTWASAGGGGWGHQWVDLARGSGDFNSLAFDADSNPAVAFYNGKYGVLTFDRLVDGAFTGTLECTSQADCPEGLDCIMSTGWCWNLVARPSQAMLTESVSLAIAPDGRFMIAYFDPDNQNLMIAHSMDGIQWTTGMIDSDGATGLFPSLVINPVDGMPAVAYYRCSNYQPGQLSCNPNQDGPRFAHFAGVWPDELGLQNKWKKSQSLIDSSDSDATDGEHIKAAFLPDGQVGIAYTYAWVDPVDSTSHQAVMFKLGAWAEQ